MSALANANTHHANVDTVQLNSEPAVTSISVTARIDYIQRFSKQAVLVVDQDVEVYTHTARQFLTSLSKEQTDQESNVAFVSASTKLNDIQMRCRLIEQLFASTLFDPEKSLAVSILQLSKQNKDSITIVVEHAHALSLQIKYELCQLVDVANKTHNKINVVLFGKEQAAQEIAAHKAIFHNKLTIIDAKSGQVFTLEHAKFKTDSMIFTQKFWQKLLISLISICMFIGFSWYVLIEFDNFSLSKLPLFDPVKIEQPIINKNSKTDTNFITGDVAEQASTEDVQAALLGKVTLLVKVNDKPAKATDILQALVLKEAAAVKSVITDRVMVTQVEPILPKTVSIVPTRPEKIEAKQVEQKKIEKQVNAKQTIELTPEYYLNSSIGHVVQIVGFSDMSLLSRFIEKYPTLEYFSYQKSLNDQLFVVLTTKVFDSREQASLAIEMLPQDIKARGVWIKKLSTIKAEITALE